VRLNPARSAIHGHCEPGFEAVADVLAENLRSGREIGASIGLYQAGRPVARIWDGLADRARGIPWGEQTLTPIASVTKALATVALLSLVDRGLIDLDKPVATYWPAFGQNGKADVPVHLVLSQRSGVAALDTAVSNDQAAALDPVLRHIEQQRPWWRPGAKHGYHAITYGFITSGFVRAVTGRTLGRYFADEIAAPLGLDLYIGLPSALHSLVAPMVGPSQVQAIRAMLSPVWLPYVLGLLNPRSASYKATFGGSAAGFNDTEELVRYEVEDPSAGAVGNGPSLARMLAALLGPVDGRRLISPNLMNAARQTQASGRDVVLRMRTN
jgi:CubicO group peptidase (beta-lactamase class C family)